MSFSVRELSEPGLGHRQIIQASGHFGAVSRIVVLGQPQRLAAQPLRLTVVSTLIRFPPSLLLLTPFRKLRSQRQSWQQAEHTGSGMAGNARNQNSIPFVFLDSLRSVSPDCIAGSPLIIGRTWSLSRTWCM